MKCMANIFKVFIKIYQTLISPFLGVRCRFTPTCSEYTYECLDKFHLNKAIYLSLKRVLKCHPWSHGGYDPVNLKISKKSNFSSNN